MRRQLFLGLSLLVLLQLRLLEGSASPHLLKNIKRMIGERHFESLTPCSDYFRYYQRNGQIEYGVISVDFPDETVITLNVELSVGNTVQGYNGELELAGSKDETINNYLSRGPLMYKLYFPRWYRIPPKVTKIVLNGDLLCTGPHIEFTQVRVLTTINLQHTLKINIPSTALAGTRFEPHPTAQVPIVDFNPTPPRDPTKIFHNNPFFAPSTQATRPQRFDPVTEQTQLFFGGSDEGKEVGVNSEVCGRSVSTNSLIANGRDVQKGEYPWLVAIFLVKSLGPEFLCGGSLISSRHVVTAGHCMKSSDRVLHVDKIFLRLGEHNLHQWLQTSGSKTVGASRILVHPDYKPMTADADVALIYLQEDVQFTKLIRPICLWSEDLDLARIVGRVGTVVGWGKDESNSMVTPEPKKVDFPVVSQEECLRSHFTFREITSERTFCAGYKNGSGPCNGDSGGGFMLQRNNRWTLRGIVSMSIAKDRTCDFSQYFVFTDITKFLQWLFNSLKT